MLNDALNHINALNIQETKLIGSEYKKLIKPW